MKKRLRWLLGKVAEHTLASVVALMVALGAGLVIGNPGEVVRSSPLEATTHPREAGAPSGAHTPEEVESPEATSSEDDSSEGAEPSTGGKTMQSKPIVEGYSPVGDWPAGVSAWTVILASEQTENAARAAVEKAGEASASGLSLGVLHSNDYASLRSGYWVAFAGQFASSAQALEAAERFRSQFPTAYPRFVEG
jgi:hypothetical protein